MGISATRRHLARVRLADVRGERALDQIIASKQFRMKCALPRGTSPKATQ
jgi:hypothetical protein